MRTAREIELLKARNIIGEQIDLLLSRKVINMHLYKKLALKYFICYDLLIEERKRKLKIS